MRYRVSRLVLKLWNFAKLYLPVRYGRICGVTSIHVGNLLGIFSTAYNMCFELFLLVSKKRHFLYSQLDAQTVD